MGITYLIHLALGYSEHHFNKRHNSVNVIFKMTV